MSRADGPVSTDLLKRQILKQTEYLFSTANLAQNKELRALMDQDASRQGTCPIPSFLELSPRLDSLVAELAAREEKGSSKDAVLSKTKALMAACANSQVLVTNRNLHTIKRSVHLPDPPELFDPDARPEPPLPEGQTRPRVAPPSPRRIDPHVWCTEEASGAWVQEMHDFVTASTKPRGGRGRPLVAWRPVTEAERFQFNLADFVIRKLWVCDLPDRKAWLPQIDSWSIQEFFLNKEQLQRLEARRMFAYAWRGEPVESKRLRRLREGAANPPTMPLRSGSHFSKEAKEDLEAMLTNGEGPAGFATQLKFWGLDASSQKMDLTGQDMDPAKVPALAAFIASTRNCEWVDIRSNPRLSVRDGVAIAAALVANFKSSPAPKFMDWSSRPRAPALVPDGEGSLERSTADRVRQVQAALEALREAMHKRDASFLGERLRACFELGVEKEQDIESALDLFSELIREVGTRVPGRGSILWFNAMAVHTLRSGSAQVADVKNCNLGATDVAIFVTLLTEPLASPPPEEGPSLGFGHSSWRPTSPSIFIRELSLSGNEGMGNGGAGALADAIAAHAFPVLVHLGLAGCGLGARGFRVLAKALRLHGATLTELDLSLNRAGPRGLTELVERFLFPRNTIPAFASAADAIAGRLPAAPPGQPSPRQPTGQPTGRVRDLNLKTLRLCQDVGNFTAFGEDFSGIESLAACLVHPDAACCGLDLLYVGGAALPVLHLRGKSVELSSNEATAAAMTFAKGKVELPQDPFADAQADPPFWAHPSRFDNDVFRGRASGTSRVPGTSSSRKDAAETQADRPATALDGPPSSSASAARKERRAARRNLAQAGYLSAPPGQASCQAGESVRPSDVRARLMARVAQGPLLRGRGYPATNDFGGTLRGRALKEVDLSLQGAVITVEDCVVIAALVEENETIQDLKLNSHCPLPVKALRGDAGFEKEILDFSNHYWYAQEVLVAARLLRHNRKVRTIRLCDNYPASVAGAGASSSYPRAGLGDLAVTLTPPMQGLNGPQLSVVGRRPPRGRERRRGAADMANLVGRIEDEMLREGRPPLYMPNSWFTACRPDFVDLSNCEITSRNSSDGKLPGDPAAPVHGEPSPLDLLAPVLRGLYCWGLEHARTPDSLVLIRKDKMPAVDAAIRATEPVPDRLSSPYSPHRKARAKRGGPRHLNTFVVLDNSN
eukprot:CAMPEP_0172650528 /NCGR_PEP_ID=MMETSP1068-20121228/242338_1 /TAXON_ID=35684 /ORGANISM="Pseudopedinella elastica, Strain CCMP716" /LENGTH=1182 /DNA_ID=CAMNT_0013464895 /DNA_START=73 /DNA_END=3621 /DNA_ORIENTATION=-